MDIQEETRRLLTQGKVNQEVVDKIEEVYTKVKELAEIKEIKLAGSDLMSCAIVVGISTPRHEGFLTMLGGHPSAIHRIIFQLMVEEIKYHGHSEDQGD